MSIYILQKENVGFGGEITPVGTEFYFDEKKGVYRNNTSHWILEEDEISNDEWFKLKKEESVLPDRYFIRNGITFKLDKEIIDCVINILKIKYTEEDMRYCHINAYWLGRDESLNDLSHILKTNPVKSERLPFEDYINSLNK